MEAEAKKETGMGEDEVSLVDLIAVLIRKRRIWLGITAAGAILAAGLLTYGRLAPALGLRAPTVQSTIRALVLDEGVGRSAASLAGSGACADLVAESTDEAGGVSYRAGASASYDTATHILSLSVKAGGAEEAKRLALAGYEAATRLGAELGPELYARIADKIEAAARDMGSAPASIAAYPSETLAAAASARAARIVAEAELRTRVATDPAKEPAAALAADIARTRAEIEQRLMVELSAGDAEPASRAEAVVSALAAGILRHEARSYRAIAPRERELFWLLDQIEKPVPSGFNGKSAVLLVFAALFLGILAAFAASAWDTIKADPEAMAKLRKASGESRSRKRVSR